jgi:putative DNA primase/helicase
MKSDNVQRIFDKVRAEKRKAADEGASVQEFSDDALALHFAADHANDLRYVDDWGRWLRWDGTRWQFDKTRTVFTHSRAICRAAATEAERNKPKLCKELASARTVAAVATLARCDPRLAVTVEQWDAQLFTFNTGEIDHD